MTYWINAYNAFVIFAVLKRWPLKSVLDVKAPIEMMKGLGFFFVQRYIVGGRPISLYGLEHKKLLKKGADPRIHFLLNCGTESCPALRPIEGSGQEMDALLGEAAADFVSNPEHVAINHQDKLVTVSRIFKWYMKDFVRGQTGPSMTNQQRLMNYIKSVAPPAQAAELERASTYRLNFKSFDWKVNSAI